MPRPTLHPNTPQDQERRQTLLDETVRFMATKKIPDEQARAGFLATVEAAEKYLVARIKDKPESDRIRQLAYKGCMSHAHVTWLLDRCIFQMIFGIDGMSAAETDTMFRKHFPEPEVDESEVPHDEWITQALKDTEGEPAPPPAPAAAPAAVGSSRPRRLTT